jgi:hypothetical protein
MTGSLVDHFSSRRVRCDSGTIRFTAHLDGTRQAPLRDGNAATGTYRSPHFTAEVFMPWHEVAKLKIPYTMKCVHGKPIKGVLTFNQLPLREVGATQGGASFSGAFTQRDRVRQGATAIWQFSAQGSIEEASVFRRSNHTPEPNGYRYGMEINFHAGISFRLANGAYVENYCSNGELGFHADSRLYSTPLPSVFRP